MGLIVISIAAIIVVVTALVLTWFVFMRHYDIEEKKLDKRSEEFLFLSKRQDELEVKFNHYQLGNRR